MTAKPNEVAKEKRRRQIKRFGEWLIKNADEVVADIDYSRGIDITCSFYVDSAPEIEINARYIDLQMLDVFHPLEDSEDE